MVRKFKGILLLYGILLNMPAFGDELECLKCHQKVYEEIIKSPYKHPDFIQRDCVGCHISKRSSFPDVNISENPKAMRVNLRNYDEEHIAILNNLSKDSIYQVKIMLRDKDGRKNESEILKFIPSSISEIWANDMTPPVISNIKVNSIDISVVTSGEIGWETDELSDSKVEYGTTEDGDYKYYSNSDAYTKKHIIKLNNLENKKKYHFRVISSDLFGNKTVSDDYTFDVSKPFNFNQTLDVKKDNNKPDFRMVKVMRLKPKEGIMREKDSVMPGVAIYFATSSEVTSVVEYTVNKTDNNIKGIISTEDIHGKVILKTIKEVGIDTCVERCHRQGASHPVGVPSRGNIKIPDNLPTSEGKVIICITCHMPHGSKERYLARIDFKTDICVLCHIDRL
ncbi:MAG: hypothetical protein HY096_12985 [Nitrospinae bacterium]|nr:hypothetical protein [Nitrospinota bacterium]